MLRKLLFIAICFSCSFSSIKAQDAGVFSQFFAAPMQLNPALTGGTFAPRIFMNYRNQWPSLNNAFVTYAVAYDQMVPDINSAFGVSILSDVAGNGIYNTTSVNGSYAYMFKTSNDIYVKGGLEVGFTQIKLNWNELVFLDQLDPLTGRLDGAGNINPTNETTPFSFNKIYPDFSAGMLVFNETFYGGMSVKHLNGPDESFLNDFNASPVPVRWTVHGGTQINLRKNHRKYIEGTFISPNVMYVRQGAFQQLNAGAYASTSSVFGGLWYRHAFGNPDAVIGMIGMKYYIFKIGYSYDYTISQLSAQSNGAHEISVGINFEEDPNIRRKFRARRYTDCFQMFR